MYARAVRTPTLLLALAVASFAPFQARADVATPGYRHVPLELTLQVKGLESSSGLVVLGCNSANGRHSLAFPESGAMIRCQIKHPAEIFVAKAADVSALRALVDKDVGWGQEIMNAREILDPKAASCGKLAERTYLEEKLGIEKVVARYEVVIQKSECSLSRLDPDAAAPASSAAPGPSAAPPATSADVSPASSVASREPPSAAEPPKSGCAGCTLAARRAPADPRWFAALIALPFLRRRRR